MKPCHCVAISAVQATVNEDPKKRHERDLIGKESLQAARLEGQGSVPPRRLRKSTRAKSQPRGVTEPDKENRHPFALYGSGEKQAEMAAKRTHNVGPCTSTSEVRLYKSATAVWLWNRLRVTLVPILTFGPRDSCFFASSAGPQISRHLDKTKKYVTSMHE